MATHLTFTLLVFSVFALWFPGRLHPWSWALFLTASLVLGFSEALLGWQALAVTGVLAILCVVLRRHSYNIPQRRPARSLIVAGIGLTALAMGLHLVPGFSRLVLIDAVILGPDSPSYTGSIKFDTVIAGVLILGLCVKRITDADGWLTLVKRGAGYTAVTIVIVIGAAFLSGYVSYQPKWTALFLPWVLMNFLTCVSEEAFFRGLIQTYIAEVLGRHRHGQTIAVLIAASLFGLAHYAGGPVYVLLAALAGIGYGLVYKVTGRIEAAILTHLLVNSVHFIFFTYPRFG